MGNHTNAEYNRRSSSRIAEKPIAAQLVFSGQIANVQIVEFSADSAGLCSPTGLALVQGDDVRVLLTPSTRRFAQVRHAGWVDTDYRVGVTWKCAYYRDAARAAVSAPEEALPDIRLRFQQNLPAQLYTFWQLMDVGRLFVLVDLVDRFERAARNAGHDLLENCQGLKDAIKNKASDESVASLLDQLCAVCVLQTVTCVSVAPHSTPVIISDTPYANAARKEFLGTSTWVLGTTLVLAGHLLTII